MNSNKEENVQHFSDWDEDFDDDKASPNVKNKKLKNLDSAEQNIQQINNDNINH